MLREALETVLDGGYLRREQAKAVLGELLSADVRPEQVAALLAGLRTRGESGEELAGFAEGMRERAVRVALPGDGRPAVDTCGTGGDGSATFNVSTTAAFVVAAAGAVVAKHGNRSVSSRCGSADVLEALGIRIEQPVAVLETCLKELGIAFLFAPLHHPAMRAVMPVRKAMGVRTAFNLIGPLCNPASVRLQVAGVFAPRLGETMARALGALGAEHALVVCGEDGEGGWLDEVSPCGPTRAWDWADGRLSEHAWSPEDLGVPRATLRALKGGDAAENAAALRSVLGGEPGPRGDAVALSAGAAIFVAGLEPSVRDGVERAKRLLVEGAGLGVLEGLRRLAGEG